MSYTYTHTHGSRMLNSKYKTCEKSARDLFWSNPSKQLDALNSILLLLYLVRYTLEQKPILNRKISDIAHKVPTSRYGFYVSEQFN